MDEEQLRQLPDRLEVRELQDRVHRKGFRVQTLTLVTNLLDATRYPVEALAQLYSTRWGIGVSREGHRNQSVEVRPRPKRLKPRSLGGTVA